MTGNKDFDRFRTLADLFASLQEEFSRTEDSGERRRLLREMASVLRESNQFITRKLDELAKSA